MSSPIKNTKCEDRVFSPIKSPVAELPKGNLTGKPRKLKDAAADIHNLILTWKQLNVHGAGLVNQISNIKLEKVFQKDDDDDNEQRSNLPLSLEPLCEQLLTVYKDMNKVLKKLDSISAMINGIIELSNYKHGESNLELFFKTWSLHDFAQTIREIYDMYLEELKLKKCLIENVAHATNRETMMFYSAAWIHQPYISPQIDCLLDSLLLETGLK